MIYRLEVIDTVAILTVTHESDGCEVFIQYVQDQFNYQACLLHKMPNHILPESVTVPKTSCYTIQEPLDAEE